MTLKPLIQGHPQSAKVHHIDFKIAYTSLIIGPRGFLEIMGLQSSDMVRFDLGPLLQSQTMIAKPKSAYNSLIICPRGLQCETNL